MQNLFKKLQHLRQQTARHYDEMTQRETQGGGGKNRFSV
jgi:hypothetical protein